MPFLDGHKLTAALLAGLWLCFCGCAHSNDGRIDPVIRAVTFDSDSDLQVLEFNRTFTSNATWTASMLSDNEAPANATMENGLDSQSGQSPQLRGTTGGVLCPVGLFHDQQSYVPSWVDWEALKEAALDPYIAFRDAYIQNRTGKVAR
jgi:hypothetical protein